MKNKTKDVQKKKLIDIHCESNINTVAEELVSSENITEQQGTGSLHSDDIIAVDVG